VAINLDDPTLEKKPRVNAEMGGGMEAAKSDKILSD